MYTCLCLLYTLLLSLFDILGFIVRTLQSIVNIRNRHKVYPMTLYLSFPCLNSISAFNHVPKTVYGCAKFDSREYFEVATDRRTDSLSC